MLRHEVAWDGGTGGGGGREKGRKREREGGREGRRTLGEVGRAGGTQKEINCRNR